VTTQWSTKTRRKKAMTEQTKMVQPVNPSVQQNDRPARTQADLDRVVLADVRTEWVDFQSSRDRDAIYAYLHQVYMQVNWWSKNPKEKEAELKAFRDANPSVNLPTDEYAAVIMCTADPKRVDAKTRSKWSRVLRYAAEFKPDKELQRHFLQRKGGINKCAARYTRHLGRNSKAKAISRKQRGR
jgi:hypothetical protein